MRSESYETDVLVFLYRNPRVLAKFSPRLEPHHFRDEVKGEVWRLLRGLWQGHRERPSLTALEAVIVDAASETPPTLNDDEMPHVADLLATMTNGRYIMEGWVEDDLTAWLNQREIERAIREAEEDVALGQTHRVFDRMRDAARRINVSPGTERKDFFERFYKIVRQTVKADTTRCIRTDLRALTAALGGGLYKGEFGIVFGVEGVFKSFLAINIGFEAVRHGYRVLHVTNEMSLLEVESRYVQLFADVGKKSFRVQAKRLRDMGRKLRRYKGRLTVEYLPPREKPATIWMLLESARHDGNPYDVVLVDWLDQFEPSDGREYPDWLRLEILCQELFAMAKPEKEGGADVLLLAVSHADSKAYGKRYGDNRFMGRSKIGKAKVVDFSLFMGQDESDEKKDQVIVTVAKAPRNRIADPKRRSFALIKTPSGRLVSSGAKF